MAWIDDEPWGLEQGVDGVKIFELYEDTEQTIPWQFVGWDINATLSDEKGGSIVPLTVDAEPSLGIVKLIIPEAQVNAMKPGKVFRYDALLVSPGGLATDDHFLVAGTVSVSLRTTRRDP